MHIPKAAADIEQVNTIDAYPKIMALNDSTQGLVEFVGFHFLIKQSLQFFNG